MSVPVTLNGLLWGLFSGLSAVAVAGQLRQHRILSSEKIGGAGAGGDHSFQEQTTFKWFQRRFLTAYLLAVFADWLQGPYVYVLYREYGFSISDIGVLFIAGFGASAVFGCCIGCLADVLGRRAMCLSFCVIYGASCITKHFNSFGVLLGGRLLAGAATSVLFSVFDAWMVYEHHARRLPDKWLSETFTTATFGNGVAAILAGLFASLLAGLYGPVAPFDASIVVLVVCAIALSLLWTENFGVRNKALPRVAPTASLKTTTTTTISSLFNANDLPRRSSSSSRIELPEAALYSSRAAQQQPASAQQQASRGLAEPHTTKEDDLLCFHAASGSPSGAPTSPSLSATAEQAPVSSATLNSATSDVAQAFLLVVTRKSVFLCGCVQALFEGAMYTFVFVWTPSLPEQINHGITFSCFMVCIMIGSSVFAETQRRGIGLPLVLVGTFLTSAVCFALCSVVENPIARLFSFLLFEVMCGVYFPAFYSLRAEIVPDKGRATILNLYRLPLNGIVVVMCLQIKHWSLPVIFLICFTMQVLAGLCAFQIHRCSSSSSGSADAALEANMPVLESVREAPSNKRYSPRSANSLV